MSLAYFVDEVPRKGALDFASSSPGLHTLKVTSNSVATEISLAFKNTSRGTVIGLNEGDIAETINRLRALRQAGSDGEELAGAGDCISPGAKASLDALKQADREASRPVGVEETQPAAAFA